MEDGEGVERKRGGGGLLALARKRSVERITPPGHHGHSGYTRVRSLSLSWVGTRRRFAYVVLYYTVGFLGVEKVCGISTSIHTRAEIGLQLYSLVSFFLSGLLFLPLFQSKHFLSFFFQQKDIGWAGFIEEGGRRGEDPSQWL